MPKTIISSRNTNEGGNWQPPMGLATRMVSTPGGLNANTKYYAASPS